ncbi:C40 family peptidase [Streptomyces sp. NBC_01497]|uniref:C40 family peptidase n=1 Tax=Streptomyces sp. NBC_01497 TaxID=2903885 RepID=UPI002E36DE6A|nr:NlpC/P60 family protein [Streptomyces sp. NBC_01497]
MTESSGETPYISDTLRSRTGTAKPPPTSPSRTASDATARAGKAVAEPTHKSRSRSSTPPSKKASTKQGGTRESAALRRPQPSTTPQAPAQAKHPAQPVRKTAHPAQPVRKTAHPAQPVRKTAHPAQPVRKTAHPAQPVRKTAHQAVTWALAQVGTPYQWGGTCTRPHGGAPMGRCDCSSLVQQAYRSAGISLGRTTYAQVNEGSAVPLNQLMPGDLLFYVGSASRPEHVAMYVGNGKVVQAPRPGRNVDVVDLAYNGHLLAARRVS